MSALISTAEVAKEPIRREGILSPVNHSFDAINAFVHHPEVSYEELGWALLGIAGGQQKIASEMARYLPILERAEANPEIWAKLTAGTGIATANGYRHAMKLATEGRAP